MSLQFNVHRQEGFCPRAAPGRSFLWTSVEVLPEVNALAAQDINRPTFG